MMDLRDFVRMWVKGVLLCVFDSDETGSVSDTCSTDPEITITTDDSLLSPSPSPVPFVLY